jgi:hypothetical protein
VSTGRLLGLAGALALLTGCTAPLPVTTDDPVTGERVDRELRTKADVRGAIGSPCNEQDALFVSRWLFCMNDSAVTNECAPACRHFAITFCFDRIVHSGALEPAEAERSTATWAPKR